jgi:glycosyltransferase involved in cell wall biosynthesis
VSGRLHAAVDDRRPSLSVVVPVHNEEAVLETEVRQLTDELDERALDYEVVLSENGSIDRTAELADRLAVDNSRIVVLHLPLADYGAAMRAGMAAARGDSIANFDIDFYDVDFLLRGHRLMDRFGIVVGSKIMPGAQDRRSFFRKLVSRVFTLTLRVLFDRRLDDTHGMKVIRRDVIDRFLPQTVMTKDLFDTELVLRARRGGIDVRAVPVVVEEKRPARLSILRRIPRSIKGILRLRLLFWKEQLLGK